MCYYLIHLIKTVIEHENRLFSWYYQTDMLYLPIFMNFKRLLYAMEDKTYTIKDIAQLAGVSAGTVDRVLHNRGEVSESSRLKVQKVLNEINYQPNMFAIGLAAKKKYHIVCLIPYYVENDYWHSVSIGIDRASRELKAFNVNVSYIHYCHEEEESYVRAGEELLLQKPDAVLIAPNFRLHTLEITRQLDELKTPYIFIDFNVKESQALKYIGQDSYMSGYIAAKILMRDYNPDKELVLFLPSNKDNPAEIQMQRRIEGFMRYLAEEKDALTIYDVILDKDDSLGNKVVLDSFFSEHPRAKLGASFNSRVYLVGEYLKETGRQLDALIGYDLLPANVDLLKSGEVKYLLGQRPGLQGYHGVKSLCEFVMLKKITQNVKYMPIDILMKENIAFYFEFE